METQQPRAVAAILPQPPMTRTKPPLPPCVQDNFLVRVQSSIEGELKVALVDLKDGSTGAGGFPYRPMVQPQVVIPHIKIISAKEVMVADREAIELRAEPRRHNCHVSSNPLGNVADEYKLTVDKERGVLLRHVSLHRGKAFLGEELYQVRFEGAAIQPNSQLDRIADVVGLLYRARDSFSTLRASMRFRSREGPNRTSQTNAEGSNAEREIRSQLWVDNPSRFREDIQPHERYSGPIGYLLDGDVWWERYLSGIVTTNCPLEQIPFGTDVRVLSRPTRPAHECAESAIISQISLDPSGLISNLRMEPIGRMRYEDREVIRVHAEPVEDLSSRWSWWEESDWYELLVDSKHGILLRVDARTHGGEVLGGVELTGVELGVPIPRDVFVFKPSPNTKVEVSPSFL